MHTSRVVAAAQPTPSVWCNPLHEGDGLGAADDVDELQVIPILSRIQEIVGHDMGSWFSLSPTPVPSLPRTEQLGIGMV